MARNELFRFETYIMSASMQILADNNITAAYAQQETSNLPTPRVEVQAVIGQPNGHTHISASKAMYDAWNANLNVVVVTERTLNQASHYEFTSKVIELLGDYANYNSGSLLPYHYVARADHQGSVPSIEAVDNKDLSALNFVLSVWIRPEKW